MKEQEEILKSIDDTLAQVDRSMVMLINILANGWERPRSLFEQQIINGLDENIKALNVVRQRVHGLNDSIEPPPPEIRRLGQEGQEGE